MSTISTEKTIVTFISIYTVAPAKQQELVDLLVRATGPMGKVPGFISANVHRSLDGTKVANYTQWEGIEDFHRMQKDPTTQPHMEEEAALAKCDAGLYTVVSVHPAAPVEAAPAGAV